MIWRFPVPPKHIENDWNILKPWRHWTLNLTGTFFFGAKSLARKAMPEEAAKSVAEARRRNVAEGSLQKLHLLSFV